MSQALWLLGAGCAIALEPAPTPTWAPGAFEAAARAVVERGLPDPWTLRALYLDALSAGDAACPGSDDDLAPPEVSLSGCTSSSGWTYAGVSTFEETGTPEEPDFRMLNADFSITGPSGEALRAGGSFGFRGGGQGTTRWWEAEVMGSWGTPGVGGWLDPGGGVMLYARLTGDQAQLDGALDHPDTPLYTPGLELGACANGGADGELRLRSPGGVWASATLDCGCGFLEEVGQELGEVCVDLGPLWGALAGEGGW